MSRGLSIRIDFPGGTSLGAELHHSPAVIGRSSSADIVLNDPRVSRRHAEISWDDRIISVTDLQSRNGTYVAGSKVSRTNVPPGTALAIGDTTVTILGIVLYQNAPRP